VSGSQGSRRPSPQEPPLRSQQRTGEQKVRLEAAFPPQNCELEWLLRFVSVRLPGFEAAVPPQNQNQNQNNKSHCDEVLDCLTGRARASLEDWRAKVRFEAVFFSVGPRSGFARLISCINES